MKLIVGFVPSAYEPHHIVGEQIGEKQPHSARVFIRPVGSKGGEWAVPVATLHTSDDEGERA